MSDVAAPAAAAPAPAAEQQVTQPVAAPAKPMTPEEAHEAEYQAEMAKVRGEKPKSNRDEKGRFVPSAEDIAEYEAQNAPDAEDGDGDEGTADEKEAKPKAEEKPQPKLKKYKVNEREVEVDLSDEGKVDMYIQKGLAADEKFEQSARIQKQSLQFVEALRDDPIAVLENPRLKVDQTKLRARVEKWLYEKVRYEAAPEEERARIDEQRELERYRSQEQEVKQNEQIQRRMELKETIQKNLTPKFIAAIESANLPVTDYTLHRMTTYMRAAISKGYKNITPQDVAPLVQKDWENAQRQLFARYDGEDLIKRIGRENAEKVMRAEASRVQGSGTSAAPAKDPTPRPAAKAQEPKIPKFSSAEEMRDYMVNRKR